MNTSTPAQPIQPATPLPWWPHSTMNPIPTPRTDAVGEEKYCSVLEHLWLMRSNARQLERENHILRSTLESYLGAGGVDLVLKSFGALNENQNSEVIDSNV